MLRYARRELNCPAALYSKSCNPPNTAACIVVVLFRVTLGKWLPSLWHYVASQHARQFLIYLRKHLRGKIEKAEIEKRVQDDNRIKDREEITSKRATNTDALS